MNAAELRNASISDLARIAARDWSSVNFAAAPYLSAMMSLGTITDDYGAASGRMIVAYFLGNARTWRGPVAKAIKAELNRRIK